jgi:hypothetical protein
LRTQLHHDGEVSKIDVTFSATEQGTTVVIEHSGFRNQLSANMHHQGWDNYIKGFKLFLPYQGKPQLFFRE